MSPTPVVQIELLSDLDGWKPHLPRPVVDADLDPGEAFGRKWRLQHADVLDEIEMDAMLHDWDPALAPSSAEIEERMNRFRYRRWLGETEVEDED